MVGSAVLVAVGMCAVFLERRHADTPGSGSMAVTAGTRGGEIKRMAVVEKSPESVEILNMRHTMDHQKEIIEEISEKLEVERSQCTSDLSTAEAKLMKKSDEYHQCDEELRKKQEAAEEAETQREKCEKALAKTETQVVDLEKQVKSASGGLDG